MHNPPNALYFLWLRNILMRLKIIVFFLLMSFKALSNDTLLVEFNNKMIFYNFEITQENDLIVGTSEGVFRLYETELTQIDDQPGYIRLKDKEFMISTSLNIKRSFKFNHLLPPSYHLYQHQSFIFNDFIYLITRGHLFIYRLSSFNTYLTGSSIRSFSQNSVGTYSGIYCYGQKLDLPTYTSGKIYEKDSTFYICYDGLAIHSNSGTRFFHNEISGETLIGNTSIGFARDIIQLESEDFILSTTSGLYHINKKLDSATQIIKSINREAPVIVSLFQENITQTITFTANQILYRFGLRSQSLSELYPFNEDIEDAIDISTESSIEYLLLSGSKLYYYGADKEVKTLANFSSPTHSMILMDNESAFITSQEGAFIVNLRSARISTLFDKIEFNKGALWKLNESVKLGTIDGYYQMNTDELKKLMINLESQGISKKQDYTIFLLFATLLIILIGAVWFLKKGAKLDSTNEITSDKIRTYIIKNLNQASVKSICAHFGISTKLLYKYTYPQKPGQLITELRIQKVKDLKGEGHTTENISQITGFSINYLKKLKL